MAVKLEVTAGPMKGEIFAFEEHDTFIFGREKDAHCRIKGDSAVSRHHFLLEVNPPLARLEDLGSTNGVKVNGVKYGGASGGAGKMTELGNGDEIRVGKTTIRVEIEIDAYEEATILNENQPEDTGGMPREDTGGLLQEMLSEELGDPNQADVPDIPGYEIGRKLGEGGMGAVYFATDIKTGQEAAIKVMLPRAVVNNHARKVFQREIAVTRKLRHPNIITFLEDGFVGNVFYVALEFVPGGDLDGFLKERGGKIPYKEAMPLMLQCLKGLSYAHDEGFIHRDIKPQNILLDIQDGKHVAKISDMGLAKNFERAGLSGFTATGTSAGTPGFMPKEQLLDFKRANPSSDVFSIAATFYTMLTGSFVYNFSRHSDGVVAILQNDITPLKERGSSIPGKFAEVIDKALDVEMSNRYQNAGEMREALKSVLR